MYANFKQRGIQRFAAIGLQKVIATGYGATRGVALALVSRRHLVKQQSNIFGRNWTSSLVNEYHVGTYLLPTLPTVYYNFFLFD